MEEPKREGRETSEGITRANVSNVAQEVLLRFLASQVTSYNPSFANAPSQAMNKIQETYQNAQERASGGPPPRATGGAGAEAGRAPGEGSRQPPAASQASVQQQQQQIGGGHYLGAVLGQGAPGGLMPPPPSFPGWGPGGGGYQQPSSPALGYQQPAPPKGVPPIYGELGLGRYGIAPPMPGGWQERQGRQQGYQGRDTSRGRGRPERVIPRCGAYFPIPPPSADVDELVEN